MRLIDADRSDEIIVFDKQNELLQCSVVRDYCERQREFLNKFPTVDAEPIVHGHWVEYEDNNRECYCSNCEFPAGLDAYGYHNMKDPYCRFCGAKMDEVSE